MSARSRSIQSLRRRGTESEWRVARRAVTESVGTAFGSIFANFGRPTNGIGLPGISSEVYRRCTGRSRSTSIVESSRPLSTISGGNPGHRGVAKHSGPQGNSGTAMFARSGPVSSPGALAVSSPERVRRAHRFLIKAASKSVDRAGSRDQADAHWSDGQRRRRSAAEHSIPSINSWPTYPPKSITVWGYAEYLVPHRLIRVNTSR